MCGEKPLLLHLRSILAFRISDQDGRNSLEFLDQDFSISDLISKAIGDAKEWIDAQTTIIAPPRKSFRIPSPENQDIIICRSDAAWRQDINAAGLGWSFAINLACLFPLLAEALAM
ncbi:unnamed protein product [Thlaspi arvense]|uniref:Uncharacterized protein n=1 Tax=Thlaspi arvense TaxID=13288 RepID=A0AAU9RNU5_THLAR|nr:unnamed protein product [Thlaspi arvense]